MTLPSLFVENLTTSSIYAVNDITTSLYSLNSLGSYVYSALNSSKVYDAINTSTVQTIIINSPAIQDIDSRSHLWTGENTFNTSINFGTISTEASDSIPYNTFARGTHKFDGNIILGKGDTGVQTTFDLSANFNSYGIKYNGPINFGKNTSNLFNLDASDGIINYGGNINVYKNLRIKPGGNFIIESSDNSITILETHTEITNQFQVSNNGTGPALVVNQSDSNSHDIANFQDGSNNVFTIGYDGDTQIKGRMSLGYPIVSSSPFNSIDDSLSTLDVSGNINIGGNILLSGDLTNYSDIRLKTNITPLTDCLKQLDTISGYKYNRNDLPEKEKTHIGLIAQEVEAVYPELVFETNNIKSVNYQSFTAILLEGIKELTTRVEILEKNNKELNSRLFVKIE